MTTTRAPLVRRQRLPLVTALLCAVAMPAVSADPEPAPRPSAWPVFGAEVTLVPALGVVIDADGAILRADLALTVPTSSGGWVEVYRTQRGTIVATARLGESADYLARPFGPLARGPGGAAAVETGYWGCAAAQASPLGGPAGAGVAIAKTDKGPYLIVDPANGTGRWADAIPAATSGPTAGLGLLPDGLAGAALGGAVPAEAAVAAVNSDGSLALAVTGGTHAPMVLRPQAGGGGWQSAPCTKAPDVVLGFEGDRAIGATLGAGRAWGPSVISLGDAREWCNGQTWMTASPPGPAVRVARGGTAWLEWRGMAIQPATGAARMVWDDPWRRAVSPDSRWVAAIDGYRSAKPWRWQQDMPPVSEVWLVVVPAAEEYDAPVRRPQARWAHRLAFGPSAASLRADPALRPVWSRDGSRVACAGEVLAGDSGRLLARLPRGAWAVRFQPDGRLIWADDGSGGDGTPSLRVWDPTTGRSEALALDRALPVEVPPAPAAPQPAQGSRRR